MIVFITKSYLLRSFGIYKVIRVKPILRSDILPGLVVIAVRISFKPIYILQEG